MVGPVGQSKVVFNVATITTSFRGRKIPVNRYGTVTFVRQLTDNFCHHGIVNTLADTFDLRGVHLLNGQILYHNHSVVLGNGGGKLDRKSVV